MPRRSKLCLKTLSLTKRCDKFTDLTCEKYLPYVIFEQTSNPIRVIPSLRQNSPLVKPRFSCKNGDIVYIQGNSSWLPKMDWFVHFYKILTMLRPISNYYVYIDNVPIFKIITIINKEIFRRQNWSLSSGYKQESC